MHEYHLTWSFIHIGSFAIITSIDYQNDSFPIIIQLTLSLTHWQSPSHIFRSLTPFPAQAFTYALTHALKSAIFFFETCTTPSKNVSSHLPEFATASKQAGRQAASLTVFTGLLSSVGLQNIPQGELSEASRYLRIFFPAFFWGGVSVSLMLL